MMKKSVLLAVFLFSLSLVSAATVTYSGGTASISSAVDLYGYELKFDSTSGSVTGVTANNFLTGTTSSGYSSRGDYDYVYESKLDSSQTGISGSGTLCTITNSGTIVLKEYLLIDSDGDEERHYCGDGTCEAGLSETTSTCSADCGSGATPDTGSPGNGNGGTTTTPPATPPDVVVVPSSLDIMIVGGVGQEREIVILNNGATPITLAISVTSGLEDVLSFDVDSIAVNPGEQESITARIAVPNGGPYVGTILFREGSTTKAEIPTVINVRSEGFLFDARISLADEFKRILLGDNLVARINLLQVGPEEKVDVVVNYIVKDFMGNSYLEETETFFVLGEKDFDKEFFSEALPVGKYVLGMEVIYPGAFATSSTQFEVVGQEGLDIVKIAIIVGVIVVVIAVLMIVFGMMKGKGKKKK